MSNAQPGVGQTQVAVAVGANQELLAHDWIFSSNPLPHLHYEQMRSADMYFALLVGFESGMCWCRDRASTEGLDRSIIDHTGLVVECKPAYTCAN